MLIACLLASHVVDKPLELFMPQASEPDAVFPDSVFVLFASPVTYSRGYGKFCPLIWPVLVQLLQPFALPPAGLLPEQIVLDRLFPHWRPWQVTLQPLSILV